MALVYVFATRAEPPIKIVPEHTPGTQSMRPFLKFTLYKKSDQTRVGYINANYSSSTHDAHIGTLKVSKEYQKQGYGKQLWNSMINELKQHDIQKVTWKAVPIDLPQSATSSESEKELETLVDWYEKRGGKVVERRQGAAYMMLKI